jgi:hypothetical protein
MMSNVVSNHGEEYSEEHERYEKVLLINPLQFVSDLFSRIQDFLYNLSIKQRKTRNEKKTRTVQKSKNFCAYSAFFDALVLTFISA